MNENVLSFLRLHPIKSLHFRLLLTVRATPFFSKGFLPTVVDKMVIQIKFHPFPSILVHQFLRMLMFTLASSSLTPSNCLIHGPNIPCSYAILLFTASDFTPITSYIHIWVVFLLWLCLFILSGVISPLFSSSTVACDRGRGPGCSRPGSHSLCISPLGGGRH